jgi:hypothetical protein|mmetsp:Transcript_62967/g.103927  ORF Transcript_62967/g.103927 Transcript_62967/m.103927 type:complete len:207 (-) Transcript_62967:338-958(-)
MPTPPGHSVGTNEATRAPTSNALRVGINPAGPERSAHTHVVCVCARACVCMCSCMDHLMPRIASPHGIICTFGLSALATPCPSVRQLLGIVCVCVWEWRCHPRCLPEGPRGLCTSGAHDQWPPAKGMFHCVQCGLTGIGGAVTTFARCARVCVSLFLFLQLLGIVVRYATLCCGPYMSHRPCTCALRPADIGLRTPFQLFNRPKDV